MTTETQPRPLTELARNRQMPDDAKLTITLGELRATLDAIRAPSLDALSELRRQVEGLRVAAEAMLQPSDHKSHANPSWPRYECDECDGIGARRRNDLRAALIDAKLGDAALPDGEIIQDANGDEIERGEPDP